MSTAENKALLSRLMEAINAGQLEELEAHPGFRDSRRILPLLQTMFGDWHTLNAQQIAEGDLVFSYGAMRTTHTGTFAGVAGTGRQVMVEVFGIDQVIGGKVVQHNSGSTWYNVLRELGATGFAAWAPRSEPAFAQPPALPSAGSAGATNKSIIGNLLLRLSKGDQQLAQQHDGIGSLIEEFRAMRAAFPDLRYTPIVQIAEGNAVGTRATLHGTHSGSLYGLAPTGKAITWDFYSLDRVMNGMIVMHRATADWNAALAQLGVLTSPAARPNVP